MGYIERRADRPRPWRVRYRDPAGRERSKSFVRKTDAERFLHSVETDIVRGEWTDPRLGRITFGEWSTRVEAGRANVSDSTRANYHSVLGSLVLPTFGRVPIGAIEPGTVREWIAGLVAEGYSASTVRRAYTLLQEALELAVGDQVIPRSPCRNIALPKAHRAEMRFLSIEEVEQEYGSYPGAIHRHEFEIDGALSTLTAYTSPSEHSDTNHTFGVSLVAGGNAPRELSGNQCLTSIVGRHILVYEFFQGRFAVTDLGSGRTVIDGLKTALWID